MLHATMLTFLQRRLQDEVDDQWTSTTILTDLLAVGISKLQAAIHDIHPAEIITSSTFNTASGTDSYTKQTLSNRVLRVEIAQSSGAYKEIPIRNFYELMDDDNTAFDVGTVQIADLGNKWFFKPTPTSIVAVRVWYVPITTDAAGWDAVQALYIPPALHLLAVDFALLEALAETAENAVQVRGRIAEGLAMIPILYGRSPKQVAPLSMSPHSSRLS